MEANFVRLFAGQDKQRRFERFRTRQSEHDLFYANANVENRAFAKNLEQAKIRFANRKCRFGFARKNQRKRGKPEIAFGHIALARKNLEILELRLSEGLIRKSDFLEAITDCAEEKIKVLSLHSNQELLKTQLQILTSVKKL